jgi:hypothetical protein
MTTTHTFVTPRCFGGRHDDREIVNDRREGLDMNGEERVRTNKERAVRERERERDEMEKMSGAFGEGAVSTQLPMVLRNKKNDRSNT